MYMTPKAPAGIIRNFFKLACDHTANIKILAMNWMQSVYDKEGSKTSPGLVNNSLTSNLLCSNLASFEYRR